MKNTSQPEGSIFRKKGFFIALYSCVGAVVALALTVSFINRNQQDPSADIAYYNEDTVHAGADQVESYLAQAEEEAWFRPRQQPTPSPEPVIPPTPQVPATPQETTPSESATPTEPVQPPTPQPKPEPSAQETSYFTAFSEDDRMVWPVYGEIVMGFSAPNMVYDPTLDQFRVNDHLRISAEEGDPVRAAADGRVVSIGRESRKGHYITIDHGNGFLTTYGQLMENPLVAEGDVVRSGQVIGGVGRQTIFTSLDGTHVHLSVTRDDEMVNPYEWLEIRGD